MIQIKTEIEILKC